MSSVPPLRLDTAFLDVADELEVEFSRPPEDPWENSRFRWVKDLPSSTKGALGERWFSQWARKHGISVSRHKGSQADRLVEGRPVEVKFSTLWKGGFYKFQQIRDQAYEHVVCFGLSPSAAHCWIVPKEIVRQHATGQHTGNKAAETAWVRIAPHAPPAWIQPYGGTLEEALAILRHTFGRKP